MTPPFLCPYGCKNLFDDDASLRRHMFVCARHPGARSSDKDEVASVGAVVLFFGFYFDERG